MNLQKASDHLSKLDLQIQLDGLNIHILWFRVMSNQGNWKISRHMHSSYEFHFIAAGKCKLILDHAEYVVGAGEFYLTAPGVYHEQQSDGEEPLIEYSLNCDLQLLAKENGEVSYIAQILSEAPCKPFMDTEAIMELFDLALQEAYNQNIGYYSSIKSLVTLMLMRTARILGYTAGVVYEVPVKQKKNDYRYLQMKKFIEDNVGTLLTTLDIAAYMHLSEKQVCRIIQDYEGMTTKQFITDVKLKKAKEFLKQDQLSIKEIADRLGFSSVYYFHQFFKTHEGYPPGMFRRNLQNV